MTHAEDRLKEYLYGNLREDMYKRRVLGDDFNRPSILLIHGIYSSSKVFYDSGFVEKLKDMGYDVVTVDYKGDLAGALFSPEKYTQEVWNQIGWDVEQFDYVIGHSQGGRVAVDLTEGQTTHGITLNSALKSEHTTDISNRDDFLLLSPFADNKEIDKWGAGTGHSFSEIEASAILEIPNLEFYDPADWEYDTNKSFGE